mmetsp:Transcript_13835/g.30826  ORF Transcript_13835/g.30826 Transcript_13835/m.30826 type:complete len:435 (-) Transcript_13835:4-1308(-)
MVFAGTGGVFVDHYACLEAFPEMPQEELKKIYFQKLRMLPSESAAQLQLTEAWEVLREPARREAYDVHWRREKEECLQSPALAEIYRRKGNDLYARAHEQIKTGDTLGCLTAVQESLKLYKAAMQQFSLAVELVPNDYRLFGNRALCYRAVEDWPRCRDDALKCSRMRPDFKKGWILLVKALWKLGHVREAQVELQNGVTALPGCKELLELQADIGAELADSLQPCVSRNVSPCVTPPHTPPPPRARGEHSPCTPGGRPVSPPLVAAGAASFGAPRARPGTSSRSPGAASRLPCPPARNGPHPALDASGSYATGNFGAPTPCFANGAPSGLDASFPVSAQAMWRGQTCPRSSYSPGPPVSGRSHSPGLASQSFGPPPSGSHSPGPSGHRGPGPDLAAASFVTMEGSRNVSPGGGRKSSSLRGLANSKSPGAGPR